MPISCSVKSWSINDPTGGPRSRGIPEPRHTSLKRCKKVAPEHRSRISLQRAGSNNASISNHGIGYAELYGLHRPASSCRSISSVSKIGPVWPHSEAFSPTISLHAIASAIRGCLVGNLRTELPNAGTQLALASKENLVVWQHRLHQDYIEIDPPSAKFV